MLDIQVFQKCYQTTWELDLLEMGPSRPALALYLIFRFVKVQN